MEARPVESELARLNLLDQMIRYVDGDGVSGREWALWLPPLVTAPYMHWTVVDFDEPFADTWADSWADRHGEWRHGFANTLSHNRLGMSWAWWATEINGQFSNIELGDSPDISGDISGARVWGDVGVCSALALDRAVQHMGTNDIWVTVMNGDTHIVIEALADVADLCDDLMYGEIEEWL